MLGREMYFFNILQTEKKNIPSTSLTGYICISNVYEAHIHDS